MSDKNRKKIYMAVALLFAFFGGYHAVLAAHDIFTLADMFASPGFLMGLSKATVPVELPPLAVFAAKNMRLFFMLYFSISLSFFITGCGLLWRRKWAQAASWRLLYLVAGCLTVILLFPWLAVPKPYLYNGQSLAPEFNAVVVQIKLQLRIFSFLIAAAAVWLGSLMRSMESVSGLLSEGKV